MPLTPDQLATLAKLQLKLSSLGVDGHFLPEVKVGPIVTLYKYLPTNATKVSQVEARADDLAIALSVDCVQVSRLADSVGIFVPNVEKSLLKFRDAVGAVWKSEAKIPILLGMDHNGVTIVEDLVKLPHLLIAGSTGGGKSTLLNSVISSLMYCKSSDELKLVLIDTKMVEFTHFEKTPHLLYPVVTSVRRTIDALEDLVQDVETRLQFMARSSCQNIQQMHEKGKKLSYVVVIIDELADILQDETRDEDEEGKAIGKKYGKQAEYLLGKIVQKARATGIHVIAATQRTSVKVVEGNIKSNFPARITFRLPSEPDSRTILGCSGAECLLSQGDMLFLSPNSPSIKRVHSPYASIEDIKTAIDIASQREAMK